MRPLKHLNFAYCCLLVIIIKTKTCFSLWQLKKKSSLLSGVFRCCFLFYVLVFLCLLFCFPRGLAAAERRDSWDRRVHLLSRHLRPGEQRLWQLLHQTGAVSRCSQSQTLTSLPTALEKTPHAEMHSWPGGRRRDFPPNQVFLLSFYGSFSGFRRKTSVIDARQKKGDFWFI